MLATSGGGERGMAATSLCRQCMKCWKMIPTASASASAAVGAGVVQCIWLLCLLNAHGDWRGRWNESAFAQSAAGFQIVSNATDKSVDRPSMESVCQLPALSAADTAKLSCVLARAAAAATSPAAPAAAPYFGIIISAQSTSSSALS